MAPKLQHPENVRTGILWMLVTMCLFTAMDAVAKYLTQTYPVPQVVWACFFFHMCFLLVLLRGSIGQCFVSGNLALQLLRSLFLLMTTVLFFKGLKTTPLATASSIMFLSPLFVTILAIIFLGESVGIRRWLGIATGFVGAMIIIRPDVGSVATGHLVVVAAAMSNALYQTTTRKVRLYDDPTTSLLFSGVVGIVATSAYAPVVWVQPDLTAWLLFSVVGFIGCLSHFCLIRSFRSAPATVVTPFGYSALLWATLFGFVIFGTLPDRWTVTGATLIILSGLYIFHREHRQDRQSAVANTDTT